MLWYIGMLIAPINHRHSMMRRSCYSKIVTAKYPQMPLKAIEQVYSCEKYILLSVNWITLTNYDE